MSKPLSPWVKELALRLYESLDCARSLTAAIMLRYEDYSGLVDLKAHPSDYRTALDFQTAYQASEFLRKFPGLPLGIDTGAVAAGKWLESEAECYRTNERLSPFLWGSPSEDERPLTEFIREMRKEVQYLVGAVPPRLINGRFGPGATVSDDARRCTIPDKLSSPPTFTADAVYWLVPWSGTAWAAGLASDSLRVPLSVKGNVWFSVPKDATTDRSCAKEPSLNGYYQRGVGIQIGERLKQRGYDLTVLPAYHQKLAREGSATGELVTIDLSSASDTICSNLVKLLLPEAWYELLDSLRSKYTLFPLGKSSSTAGAESSREKSRWVRLEKFSSMGNGFTFELETLLFLAIGRAAARRCGVDPERVSVFGDDIIVPTEMSAGVLSALSFCGFTPNKRKTYTTGEFRESCGGDFYRGEAVRPYLLKKEVTHEQDILGVANGLRRVSHLLERSSGRSFHLKRVWFFCVDALSAHVRRCRGPKDLGDICLHDDDEKRWVTRTRSSIRYIRVIRPRAARTVRWDGFGAGAQLAAALYLAGGGAMPLLDYQGKLSSRGEHLGFKIGWTPYS